MKASAKYINANIFVIYSTAQNFGIIQIIIFERGLFCSLRLHSFEQKNSEILLLFK